MALSKPQVQLKLPTQGKAEMTAILTAANGRGHEFILKSNQIRPQQPEVSVTEITYEGDKEIRTKISKSWYDALTEEEKLGVFRSVMAEYRQRSLGDKGWTGSAIGVTEDNRIFVAVNTKRQHPYFKDCAEQNMLNAVTDALVYDAMKKGNGDEKKTPPKLKAIYIMGGREPENSRDPGVPMSCPCGKCIDMLSNAMVPDAPVYILPIPRQKLPANNPDPLPYKLRHEADNVKQVDPAHEIWCTTIGQLNRFSDIKLQKEADYAQRAGLKEMVRVMKENFGKTPDPFASFELTGEGAGLVDDSTPRQRFAAALLAETRGHGAGKGKDSWVKRAHGASDKQVSSMFAVALRAAENSVRNRSSIPELDVATEQKGENILREVNEFLVKRIRGAVESRLRSSGIDPRQDKEWQKAFLEKIQTVRCVVIQLEDGTFHHGLEVESDFDNSIPNAEVNSITASFEKLPEHRIKKVWAMEMSPKDIEKGVMGTSPKEGIERIAKRAARSGALSLQYIPFNNGLLADAKLNQVCPPAFDLPTIFPSMFEGVPGPGKGSGGIGH